MYDAGIQSLNFEAFCGHKDPCSSDSCADKPLRFNWGVVVRTNGRGVVFIWSAPLEQMEVV